MRGGTQRALILFALLVTGGLTLLLSRQTGAPPALAGLPAIVVSREAAEAVVRADTLRRNEALAAVLARQPLSAVEVSAVVEAIRAYISPRVLRPGVTIAVRQTPWDSVTDVTVRIDPDREVHLAREGTGWSSELRHVPVRVDTLMIEGVITVSLYHSVMALDLPMGAEERIERVMWGIHRPFQWSIDFTLDLRKGDTYRALYERHVRADGSVRQAHVLAAEFTNRGKTHRAFWFDGRGEYFDEDGQSVKRVFLKAPLDFRRISSTFSRRRYHPVLSRWRRHLGTDYAADAGTRVFATADGTVTRADWWGGYGKIVEIRHINGYRTRYAHLNWIARGIRPGRKVGQGELIGNVGSTGLATGPHLHYELRRRGRAVDPRAVNLPSGKPIASVEADEFRLASERFMRLMEPTESSDVKLSE